MTGFLLRAGGGAVLGFISGILIGGRMALWVSPAGEHEFLAFVTRWSAPLALTPAGGLAGVLIFLSGLTTRMAKGFIGSVAGDGTQTARLAAAGVLGDQLNRSLGRPVRYMRFAGWGILTLLVSGALIATR